MLITVYGKINTIFVDLSKAFDTIEHELMIAKLSSYDFSADTSKLISSYLKTRKQRSIIQNLFSSWAEIIAGVLQGSVMSYLFRLRKTCNKENYADDNTSYKTGGCFEVIIEKLSLALISF